MNECSSFRKGVCAAGQRRCPFLFPRLREARCKRRGVPRIGTRRRQAPRRAAGGNGAREEMMPTSSYSSTQDLATIYQNAGNSITTTKPLCRSISRYFIRFLEKDSSRKLIFFLIFGRRFLEKDDFQQDPLLFEVPLPPVRKWQTDLPETRKCAVSQTKTFTNSNYGL